MSTSPLNADADSGPRLGRAAGVGYLAIFVTGVAWYGVMLNFRAHGDAEILGHIRDSRLAFEVSILAGAATFTAYLVTAALLYRRFSREAGIAATLLFALVVGSVPFSLAAVARQMELLALADTSGLTAQDLGTQAASLLRDFDAVGRLSSLFWGLWLFPLAWLAWRAGGWGRAAGAFLALGGAGYASAFVRPVLWPHAPTGPLDMAFAVATVLSEVAITLWLLLAADRPRTAKAPQYARPT